jgi:hypothetical protein
VSSPFSSFSGIAISGSYLKFKPINSICDNAMGQTIEGNRTKTLESVERIGMKIQATTQLQTSYCNFDEEIMKSVIPEKVLGYRSN